VPASHIFTLLTCTLTVCSRVFAAVLITLLLAMMRGPRASRDSGADLKSLEQPETRVRRLVNGASAVTLPAVTNRQTL
jgi:cytochrome c oxidase subunit 2